MHREGDEVHVNETEASGGVKQNGVIYVLLASLVMVVVALSLIWILGGLGFGG